MTAPREDSPIAEDPFVCFTEWYENAKGSGIKEPTACCLATATPDGAPSARMVLLKEFSPAGFVFYTNLESRKGCELLQNPRAALCFYWEPLVRQVRVEGSVERVSDEEADAYFASRSFKSKVGAWASQQSRPMKDRSELLARVVKYTPMLGIGSIARPPYWTGLRIVHDIIEFWDGSTAIPERLLYSRTEKGWNHGALYP